MLQKNDGQQTERLIDTAGKKVAQSILFIRQFLSVNGLPQGKIRGEAGFLL